MKIILSPAKKIKVDTDSIESLSEPVFKEKTDEITLSNDEDGVAVFLERLLK